MKATHTDFQHPRHLRVVDGVQRRSWTAARGWETTDAICVSPSCSDYARLNRRGLPKWTGKA